MTVAPYGPASASIRRFLVQLAALGPVARSQVVQRYGELSGTSEYQKAEGTVGDVIERSDRTDARDALGGPFMALMRPSVSPDSQRSLDPDALEELDPIAEPALGALLALLVRDLITGEQLAALHAPFAGVIALD